MPRPIRLSLADRRSVPLVAVLALVGLVVGVAGCQTRGGTATPEQAEEWSRWRYPAEAEYGRDYNLAVEQKQGRLLITNREPGPIRGQQLWLNQGYVRPLESVGLGAGTSLDLTGFVNEYREPYPVGTLLAPDKTLPVVAAEFYDPQTQRRHRVTVWPPERGALLILP